MKTLGAALVSLLMLAAIGYAQETNQDNSHPPNQSTYPDTTHKMSRAERNDTASAKGQMVDLNTATKQELAALPGIGPDYAQTIIDARPFASKQDLLKKKVIPPATYNEIQARLTASVPQKSASPQ